MKRVITIDDLKNSACAERNPHLFQVSDKKKSTGKRKESKRLTEMKNNLRVLGYDFFEEYQFAPPRKFRFDIAFIDKRIAVEYEGLMSEKSGHTTVDGYTSNTEKYNLAASMGWTLLRYTALNYKNFISDLEKILEER